MSPAREFEAVLSLGSNLGDREGILRAAVAAIDGLDGVRAVAASGIVETAALKPHGVDTDAPSYLNAVVVVATELDPGALLDALAGIEQGHGRVREERWGDRTLDIDIVAYAELTLATERLTIPHPRASTRAFVLAPWLEVRPDATIPGLGRVADLLAATAESPARLDAEPLL